MHKINYEKYYFISEYDTNLIKYQSKKTNIIFRNYNNNLDIEKIKILRDFCKKKGCHFFLSNNVKLAIKLKLDGVYLPSFYNRFDHLNYTTYSNFSILGSAHNLKEIKIKELQKVQSIFISSLFKKNNNFLGINKFRIISKYSKKNIIALGGISKVNVKKLKLLNISGFAGISFFRQKKGP